MTMRTPIGLVGTGLLAAFGALVAYAQDSSGPDGNLRFEGYSGAPEIQVVPRIDELFFYPCDECHATMEPNPEIRELDTFHDSEIDHGKGRIWCHSCHQLENPNNLVTLLDEPVSIDDSHLVCGGCHANRHKDWYFGAHGKRLVDWQGERTVYNCTHCHNPHNPAIEPRAPKPAPPVRAGLERAPAAEHEHSPIWESYEARDEP